MADFREITDQHLANIKEGLKKVREAPPEQRREMIIQLIEPVVLFHTDRVRLRQQLQKEFDFSVQDFELHYSSKNKEASDLPQGD